MNWTHNHHLAYCTNIHPAETWAETFNVLETDVLAVQKRLQDENLLEGSFAIGLRLSAQSSAELLEGERLTTFKNWLTQNDCYVFTINGFPYGNFHGTRVKEQVYQPDWTTRERLDYTCQLFSLIAELSPGEAGGSVSTLPGSFKEFDADENLIFANLYAVARHIEEKSQESGKDLHLGLEPEPLGYFENTSETLAFFSRFYTWCNQQGLTTEIVKRRIGLNYDCCHFAIEFDDCRTSLEAFREAGIRISKVHLSSALSFDPNDEASRTALRAFDEPTYLHQVIIRQNGELKRAKDLPQFYENLDSGLWSLESQTEARCHFHVPLYAEAAHPLGTTQDHVRQMLAYREENPDFCAHFEIETYTWGVLPESLQTDLTSQIVAEFEWVLG
jgi:hypothetical protein